MKRIIVCDSGLGGLNVAARFFSGAPSKESPCEIVYFNAYPSLDGGFNRLPDSRSQERLLRNVFEGMRQFNPEGCLIACNTLSIIYERMSSWYEPAFPVVGIIDAAVNGMAVALTRDADASILILGTKSTVESGVYASRLARVVSERRIRSLACPGLATRLESDPSSPEIRSSIAEYARQAYRLWENTPQKLGLALCCTHFEYALPFWLEEFRRVLGEGVFIVNPNELLAPGFRADSFSYHARIPFFPGAQESIGSFFRNRAPAISFALETARPESGLFSLEI